MPQNNVFELSKKVFLALASIVNGSTHIKCMLLTNQKCEVKPTLINLYPNEYN